jgi:hypothetical protein
MQSRSLAEEIEGLSAEIELIGLRGGAGVCERRRLAGGQERRVSRYDSITFPLRTAATEHLAGLTELEG